MRNFDVDFVPAHARLPFFSGGSITELSATDAQAKPLPVMDVNVSPLLHVPQQGLIEILRGDRELSGCGLFSRSSAELSHVLAIFSCNARCSGFDISFAIVRLHQLSAEFIRS